MLGIIATTVLALALAVPLVWVVRSDRKLTWTAAIPLGTLLLTVGLLLIGDVPSRILYYFDSNHEALAGTFPFVGPLESLMAGDQYFLLRDIVANTVQVIFFVIIVALMYFWGERHRREGRF